MNRSKHLLLATAVAAALAAAGAAQAETTLFGRAGMAVVNSDGFPGGNGNHAWDVRADDSYIGVEGKEDLGGGLSAVYFYKFVVNADGSASGQPFDQK
ncbi:porin-like protein, partial [Plasticicumulans lactativorans]